MGAVESPVVRKPATSRPLLSLGITFLLIGVGFASPIMLAPAAPPHLWVDAFSRETLNLYALTVFAGWGHFFYAWRGQWSATGRLPVGRRAGYWAAVAAALAGLVAIRCLVGVAVFSLLAWVWNVGHFAKSERFFAGKRAVPRAAWMPVVAFAWFTLCLFRLGWLRSLGVVFAGTLLLAALALGSGAWRLLAEGSVQYPLLTMFLLGETLVWSGYGPYMSDAFRVGVYVLHIAGASFFHYLSGYFYAESRGRDDRFLRAIGITAVNVATLAACGAIQWVPWMQPLRVVFGLEAFTLFVALHLLASDMLPLWHRRAA